MSTPTKTTTGEATMSATSDAAPAVTSATSGTEQPQAASDAWSGFWDGAGTTVVPALIWAAFGIWALVKVLPNLLELLPRLKIFKGLGVELEFAVEDLKQASQRQGIELQPGSASALSQRLNRTAEILVGMRILWVDDQPNNNIAEQALLRRFGVKFATAKTTNDALKLLVQTSYNAVITDMSRPEGNTAGLDLLKKAREAKDDTPFIVYTGADQRDKDRPAGLFGTTNRPDELVNLVLDVRERDPFATR